MSAIFWHDAEQRRLAVASRDAGSRRLGREIYTEILPADAFHLAEDYHQKYMLRRSPELMADFAAMYPDAAGFVASTAAARVNGYLGGWGTAAALAAEIEGFGLSEKARRILERSVARR